VITGGGGEVPAARIRETSLQIDGDLTNALDCAPIDSKVAVFRARGDEIHVSSSEKPTASPDQVCGLNAVTAPCGAGVQVGADYDYVLYTHCGIDWAIFDGRLWLAQPRLDNGFRSAPPGWGDPLALGVMRLLGENEAEFRSGLLVARFVPAPAGYAREACA